MKGRLTLWAVAAGLTVAVVGLSLRFMDPFPPNRIVLATGQPGGAYDGFGLEYQSRLAREADTPFSAPSPSGGCGRR